MTCKNTLYFGSQFPIDIDISDVFGVLGISSNASITGVNFAIKDYNGTTLVTKMLGAGVAVHPTDTNKLRVTLDNADYGTDETKLQAGNSYDMFIELLTASFSDYEEVDIASGDQQLFIRPRNISVT